MTNPNGFYMNIAVQLATASRCERQQNGAILLKDNNIIAFGYNGTPAGFDNACEDGDVTKPEVLHAEANAITKCARSTQSSENSTMYCTTAPCVECAKLIIQAGIVRVFYNKPYRDPAGLLLLIQAGIPYQQIDL